MCDGRPSPPRFFCRLAGGGPFFRGFSFRWVLRFALSVTRCLTVQDATSCPRVDPQYERGRPCATMSCLFFTSLWLQQSQPILMQEIQLAKDIDLTCYKTLPTKAITCLQVGPMSLELPVAQPAESDQSSLSPSREDPNDGHPEDTLPALTHLRWRRDALQPPHAQQDTAGRDTCGHFPDGGLRCVTWNTRGLVGSVLSSERNRELKLNYFGKLIEKNNVICLQEVHGKKEFLQAIQVWAPRFRLFGTFIPGNENAGRSAICIHKDLLPEGAIVTNVITCQGRYALTRKIASHHSTMTSVS